MAAVIRFPDRRAPRGALERASALARAEHQPLLGRLSAAGVDQLVALSGRRHAYVLRAELSAAEWRFVQQYRQLDESQQQTIDDLVEQVLERGAR